MKTIFTWLMICICNIAVYAQAVYVDSNIGDDNNPGTKESPVYSIHKAAEIIKSNSNDVYVIKINPGIYILDHHVPVATEKDMADKRIIIEASILPDEASWTPEKMPVIKTMAKTGEIMQDDLFIKNNWITGFYINESHVTIRGLKFLGHDYPVNLYYPISRFNKEKTDLIVEQCMFLADLQTAVIQVGIITHGDSVKVDHCIFYNINNAVIYWHDLGKGFKTGNSLTNSIIYGASGGAVWLDTPDKDYIFKNNVVSNCNYVWIKGYSGTEKYFMDNCVIVNNKEYKVDEYLKPSNFALDETNVIKEGNISLRMINTVREPWPIDHLHIIPNTHGYELEAGLFKTRKFK